MLAERQPFGLREHLLQHAKGKFNDEQKKIFGRRRSAALPAN
jgi:hypothetical protein